jgi:SOS-response transcriptional repressor LexA
VQINIMKKDGKDNKKRAPKPRLVEIGKRIMELREEAKITQAELGIKCGVSQKSIGKYELGWHEAPYDTIRLIAEALNTTPSYLLEGNATIYSFPQKANNLVARYLPILSAHQYKNWRYSDMEKFVNDPTLKQVTVFNADGKRLAALSVDDDSMFFKENEDSFSKKEIVIFDVERKPEPGDYVVIDIPTAPKVLVRQYIFHDNEIHLKPINPHYHTVIFNNEINILGTVCKKMRDF